MRRIWAAAATVSVLSLPHQAAADLRSDLAKSFQADAAYFVVNLPPRPGGWPGSIYDEKMRFSIVRAEQKDNPAAAGAVFDMAAEIKLDASASSGISLLPTFGISASASDAAIAMLNIEQAQIYEMTLPQLRERVKAISPQDHKPPGPVIVYRAYVGRPSLTLAKKNEADAEAWAKLKAGLAEAKLKAAVSAGEKVVITLQEPIVFAYEVARVADLPRLASAPNVYPTSSLVLSQVIEKNGLSGIQIASGDNGNIPENIRATSGVSVEEILAGGILGGQNSLSRKLATEIFKNDTKTFQAVDTADVGAGLKKFIVMLPSLDLERAGLRKVKAVDFERAYVCFSEPQKC